MVKLGFGEFSEIDPLLKRIPMTVYIYDEVGDYSEQDDLYVGFVDRL
jgi:hypothetical protein